MYFVKWKRTTLRTIVTLMATLLFVSSGLLIGGNANAYYQDELGPYVFGPTAIGEAQPYNLYSPGFDGDTVIRSTYWKPAGSQPGYTFNFNNTAGRNGSGAAFIEVPNDGVNAFPSYTQTLDVDGINLKVGKSIAFSGWLKAENVQCKLIGSQCLGVGAFISIEYYRADNTRISFDQSGPIKGNQDWTNRRAIGVIPQETAKVKLNFVLNGKGKAYFDDASLAYYSDSSVVNAVKAPYVELNVTNTALNTNISGLGFEMDPFFARGLTSGDETTITNRLNEIKPAWVRVFTDTSWWVNSAGNIDFTTNTTMLNALLKDLQICKAIGAKVNLVMWRPNNLPPTDENNGKIATRMVELIKWLQTQQLQVDGLTLFNEPDSEFPGTVAEYVAMYQKMALFLQNNNLNHVKLIGGDVSAIDTFTEQMFPVTEPLKSQLGMLSYHNYVQYLKPLTSSILRSALNEKFAQSQGLDAFVWETNVYGKNGTTAFTPGTVKDPDTSQEVLTPNRYPSMLKLSAYVMQTLAAGVKGAAYWVAFDMNYGDTNSETWMMRYGLWGAKSDPVPYKLRPAYYSYQLLSSQIQPGSSIRKVTSSNSADTTLLSYMIDKTDGSQALFLLNPWDKPVSVTANLGDASYTNQKVKRIIYNSTEVASAIAEGRLSLGETEVNLSGGSYNDVIQPESMMVIQLDKVPPVTTAALSPAQPDGQNGWYVNPVTVSLAATAGSGETYYTVDGGAQLTGTSVTLTTEGVHTLAFWSVDHAGNIEEQHTQIVKIDKTAPTTTDNAPAGWVNHDATVNLSASDSGSGVATTYYTVDGGAQQSGNSVALTTDGVHTLVYWSVDNAGNIEAQHTTTVKIDKTAPTTTDNAPAGWVNHDATVDLSASDSGLGVAATYYTVDGGAQQSGTSVVVTTEGVHILAYWSVDNVGNIEAQHTTTVKIDKTAPTTTDNAPAGWVNHDATVDLSASDSGLGVAATYYTVDGGAQQSGNSVALTTDGVHTLVYWSVDNAGNIETQHTTTVKIDKTAPLLTVQLDKTSIWPPNHKMVTVQATLNSSDATSGVASVVLTSITSNEPDSGQGDIDAAIGTSATTFSLRAERLGNGTGRIYTITYTITDNAGNKSTAVSTVSVPHNQ